MNIHIDQYNIPVQIKSLFAGYKVCLKSRQSNHKSVLTSSSQYTKQT